MTTNEYRYTFCPFCGARIQPGQAVVAVPHEDPLRQLAHTPCKTYIDKREAARPAVMQQISRNLELAARREADWDRLDALDRRARTIGALLAGPCQNEGVIDSAGKWHELENVDGSPPTSIDEEVAAIERILSRLESP